MNELAELLPRTVRLRSLPARQAVFVDRSTGSTIEANVRRNALCPCGSGRKFKRCCLAGTAHRPEPPTELLVIEEEADGLTDELCAALEAIPPRFLSVLPLEPAWTDAEQAKWSAE